MKDSLKLIQLDLLTTKKYMGQMLFSCIFVSVIIMPSLPLALNAVYFIITSSFLLYPFMVAEQNDFDVFYKMISLHPKAFVRSKYLTALFCLLGTLVLLLPINTISYAILKVQTPPQLILVLISLGIFLYSLVVAIELPFCLKYGYAKARIVSIILPITIGCGTPLLVFLMNTFFSHVDPAVLAETAYSFLITHFTALVLGSLILSGCLLLVSYLFALKLTTHTQKRSMPSL